MPIEQKQSIKQSDSDRVLCFDPTGWPVGIYTRGEAHKEHSGKYFHDVIEALILRMNNKGRLEVLCRSERDKHKPNKFKLKPTFGGHVDPIQVNEEFQNESLELTLRREMDEELSVPNGLSLAFTQIGTFFAPKQYWLHRVTAFAAFVPGGLYELSSKIVGKDGGNVEWFQPYELPGLMSVLKPSKEFIPTYNLAIAGLSQVIADSQISRPNAIELG